MAAVLTLDADARARILRRFGPEAAQWCDELPALVARFTRRWHLEVTGAVPGNTGRTLVCRDASGAFVVLKLTPDPGISRIEAIALRAWSASPRVVDLLDADPEAGAILLAGIEPGTPLSQRSWHPSDLVPLLEDVHAAAVPDGLPTLTQRVEGMFELARTRGTRRPVTPARLAAARERALSLAADPVPPALVHGDLHPANVLTGPRGFVVIDPRPCVGDPAYDGVDWVQRAATGRAEAVAALAGHLDPERLTAWTAALEVLG